MSKKYNNRYEYITERQVDWIADFAQKEGEKLVKSNNILPEELKNAGYYENILDIVERKKKISVQSKVEQYRIMVGLDLIDNIEKEGAGIIDKAASKKDLEVGQIWSGFQNGDLGEEEVFAIIVECEPQQIVARFFVGDKGYGGVVASRKSFNKQFPYFKGKVADPKNSTPVEFFSKKASRISLSIRDKIAQVAPDQIENIKQYVSQIIKNRNGAIPIPAILEQLENYMKIDSDWLREHYEEIEKIIVDAKTQFEPQKYNNIQMNELARTDEPKAEKEPPLFAPPTNSQ